MKIVFDENSDSSKEIKRIVQDAFTHINTIEFKYDMPLIIHQDGVTGSYYVKCGINADDARILCDTNAKLDYSNQDSFRANRELLLKNKTYIKMEIDASAGREFNDIIVEYNVKYEHSKPLKIWGGQHRISAIVNQGCNSNRYHGFRIFFNLDKKQRTELALISNTNISVSNDTFDRMIEETMFGNKLRKWCQNIGFLKDHDDFPDVGSRSEKISVKKARSFIVNYYEGKEKGRGLTDKELDRNFYTPILVETGVSIDESYKRVMEKNDILSDKSLIKAGERFLALHNAQYRAVTNKESTIDDKKAFRNKAMIESVLCAWGYIAGLLQTHSVRLENHYRIPRVNAKIMDPLNAEEMSNYKHDSDPPTYRGLGTRSAIKDRQRVAQLFLAKSISENVVIEKKFINQAISQVIGLITLAKGYSSAE